MKFLSTSQKVLFFLAITVFSLFLGWGLGKVLLSTKAGNHTVRTPSNKTPSQNTSHSDGEEMPGDWESYIGTIKSNSDHAGGEEGSYVLVNDEGSPILLLEAADDKLEFSSGMRVTVQGPVRTLATGNQRLMRVERIIF